jgi:hypothetical protein
MKKQDKDYERLVQTPKRSLNAEYGKNVLKLIII